ncbi:DUF1553 domain-containing protein [Singulisphaera acidiphila]|uniref:Planctomycete cytochrome C n=1 Tax=Singulisphaera acidiphila (strain ATCC BAA-1392 / DSM 18658 / VKM B-2454 / MOB10) TaxID=886293 RepID=L0DQH9_SINAD|nr:DUF1553 domain-containing protein [Singulisphaera acidiphila]AGA31165.1 Protein of unknown function (DUF1553)/Protein of unknown function (DUF1549)/Planctomycete cytochrome C [Singulisphaera acidiphila DSM 18658]
MALALSIVLSVLTKTGTAAPPPAVDFSRDVLPILSDKCFRCHGPDAGTRKADLRLDLAEGALRKKDPVIVPGKSDESELIIRIKSQDAEETMPPPKSNLTLNAREVAILERWVDQGAEWGKHWAFVAPRRQAIPQTKQHEQARNGIDLHVLARLERENLPPAPEATKEALIRRVTLDLTGLPPSPAEIDAFLADPAPDAYERVVDRLLASPRYGERMATHWLDLARYADTHGYQSDRYRAMWPWRDWVVRSFNGNQPFDEFLTWQLAGDLLPHATKEQRLATAFNRLHMQNEEGGVVEEEFRVAYVVDRVNTMATAFLGLTFECSRCHDHKYDPITQRDFYSLYAFFQNIDESGQTSYFTPAMPVPTLLLSDDATDQKIADVERRITAKEADLHRLRDQARADFQTWLTAKPKEPPLPEPAASFSFDEIAGGKLANTADPGKPANALEGPELVAGKTGRAVKLTGENGFTFPGVGHFSRADPFSLCLDLQAPTRAPRFVVLHHSKAPIDAGSRGYEILLEEGRVAVGLHHMWPGNSLKVVTKEPIQSGPWVQLTVTYDGSSRADGLRVYVDGVAAPLEVIRDGLVKDITYEGGEPDLALGFRFRDNGFKGGRVDNLRVYHRALAPLEVAHLAERGDLTAAWTTSTSQLTASQREGLLDLFLASADPLAQKQAAELHALRVEQNRLVNPIPEAMVMTELPRPKPAFVLKRGAYDAPGDPVSAGTPAALPPFPSDETRNRLGLARWLLRPEHPLTARVTVNRLWQMMFGIGIVETSDNFGSQGAQPTHPELLDWLALEFLDSGWDVKHLLRLMATSSTYRQSSKTGRDLLARDPENQLLARGPARRLTAEMLRDQALASSGLLTEWRGGPSVKPYQPDGLWEVAMGNPRYDQSKGPDLYRRSLYTFWKRTVPHPAMVAFDAAERNVCVVRRQSTSTPLQALTLLNDEQIVEAARHLGQRMLKEGGTSDGERVAWLFRLITGRRPVAREVAVLEQLLVEQRTLFGSDPQAAKALLAVGESKSDPAIDPVELAAATVLAEAVLNHDEAVLRR